MPRRVNLEVSEPRKWLVYHLNFSSFALLAILLWPMVVLIIGCSYAPSNEALITNFVKNKSHFAQLQDLIQREVYLTSIGYDNVGDFWLSGDRWINHQPPYKRYTQQEMLDSTGLPPARYKQYLNLLDSVGGYRVSKERTEGRMVVHMFKSGKVSSGTATNIVYYPSIPVFLPSAKYTELGDGWYVEYLGD